MASLFGGRRRRSPEDDGEDDRSGNGKAQRRRLSPDEDTGAPAEAGAAAGSSPGWLYGFVSGARRVFSSVLLFSSPEETGSGEEEDDADDEEGNGLNSGEQFLLRLVHSLSFSLTISLPHSMVPFRLAACLSDCTTIAASTLLQ